MDKNICWMIIDGKECFKKVSKNWNGIGVPACEEHTKIFQELMKETYDYGVNNQKEYLDQYEKGFKKGIEETRNEIRKNIHKFTKIKMMVRWWR
ncbi:hypothetical protein GL981_12895 (plasmid) [Spiroplasma citri]|nr:hypothetical protein GL981_12895 [Spiroplasma citri]